MDAKTQVLTAEFWSANWKPSPTLSSVPEGMCRPTLAETPVVTRPSWAERQTAQLERRVGSWLLWPGALSLLGSSAVL